MRLNAGTQGRNGVLARENSNCKGPGGKVSEMIENRPVVAGEWLELVHCPFSIIPLYLQAKVCEV